MKPARLRLLLVCVGLRARPFPRRLQPCWTAVLRALPRAFLPIAIVALPLAGCGHGDATAASAVRDSAGVRIVRNAGPRWSSGRGWRLDRTPELAIGSEEGPEDQQLYRVAGALRLPDGLVAVANAGSNEIRFYGAEGKLVARAGANGAGPGEFRDLTGLYRDGPDSIYAWDSDLGRVSVFTNAGVYARSFAVPRIPGYSGSVVLGPLGGRGLLVYTGRGITITDPRRGVVRDSLFLFRLSADGVRVDTLGKVLGGEGYVRDVTTGAGHGFIATGAPFGRRTVFAVSDSRFFVGTEDDYEIAVRSADGSLDRLLRFDRPSRQVTSTDVAAMKRQQVGHVNGNMRREIEKSLDEAPVPATMPAYGGMIADAAGDLWVAEYRTPGTSGTRWLVFDADGRLLGPVNGPDHFTALDIGDDYVLGVRKDEMDVEHVELYRIVKE